jgi:uncharacterized protein YaaQ
MLRIRGMLRGKVFSQQPDTFVAGLKDGVLDGIIKTVRASCKGFTNIAAAKSAYNGRTARVWAGAGTRGAPRELV